MTTELLREPELEQDLHRPLVVVSSDTHIGPRMKEDLRPYCPADYREAFDDFVVLEEASRRDPTSAALNFVDPEFYKRNQATQGHFDSSARLRDMDFDGVACEVIFHGSQNGEAIPFMPSGFTPSGNSITAAGADRSRAAVGQRIYNRWLADFVSNAPDRHLGLAQVPIWDVGAAVREVEWARNAGLRGVNFPAVRAGVTTYDDPVWEPFWGACESLEMPLAAHSGAGDGTQWRGPHAGVLMALESGGWLSRRQMHFMIFSGVFERYPRLKMVMTEQAGDWWTYAAAEYDSIYLQYKPDSELRRVVPRRPSEYMKQNVFIGASFMSESEAIAACDHGYTGQVLWGSDYPHAEGTFVLPRGTNDSSQTRLALRDAFSSVPVGLVSAMVGGNAVDVFGLDHRRLTEIATLIGAPSLVEVQTPILNVPREHGFMAFRKVGPWG